MRKLLLGILMGKDAEYYEIFLEILPYAGTKHTINLIKEIVKDEIDLHTKIKLLAIFPEYVDEINEEMVTNFEEFLTYQFDKIQIKQTALLSFSSLVSIGIERNTINDRIAEKYMKKFYEEFLSKSWVVFLGPAFFSGDLHLRQKSSRNFSSATGIF